MPASSILMFALGRSSWGRAHIAWVTASQLTLGGFSVTVVTDAELAPVFAGAPFQVELLSNTHHTLVRPLIDFLIQELDPVALVFCDIAATYPYFQRRHIFLDNFESYKIPRLAIDIWDYAESGLSIDRTEGENIPIPSWARTLPRLLPSPILRPVARPGAFGCLPACNEVTAEQQEDSRRALQKQFSLSPDTKLAMFCTGTWQSPVHHSGEARSNAEALPHLLMEAFDSLDGSTRLLHLGPEPWDIPSPKYVWHPPVAREEFDLLLKSVDIMVSANVTGTTISRALAACVPTLLLQNTPASNEAETRARCGPFRMWPLRYVSFLHPILTENPYLDCLPTIQIHDASGLINGLRQSLFDADYAADRKHKISNYVHTIHNLPTAAEAARKLLGIA